MSPSIHPRPTDALFEAVPFAQLVFTPDLTILAANARHLAMTGREAADVVGRFLFDAFPKNPDEDGPDTEDVMRASVARVIETRDPDELPLQKHDLQRPDGSFEERYWQLTHAPVEEEGEVTAILQVSRDVTADTLARRVTEAQQRAAASDADLGFFEYDPSTDRFVRTAALDELFGFAPGEAGERGAPFSARMLPGHADAVGAEIARVMAAPAHSVARFDYGVLRPDGTRRWATFRGEVIPDPVTQTPTLVGIALDLTDLKEKEEGLEAALAARDVLLAEVNHRVKNSLQLVTSILRLEAGAARGSGAEERLRAAADRVQAVASVHANLYHTDDVRTVEMSGFLPAFCENLAAACGAEARGVEVRVTADDLRLPTDRAIALALIVNELVTNAFKHAFGQDHGGQDHGGQDHGGQDPGGEEGGVVKVVLERSGDRVLLTVEDDGTRGACEALEEGGARAGLGTTLIETLARQLDAELTRRDDQLGYAARLDLPA